MEPSDYLMLGGLLIVIAFQVYEVFVSRRK
jgi:uncharacterized membrane protein YqhA